VNPPFVWSPSVATELSRRALLRATGTVSLAALLAACGDGTQTAAPSPAASSSSPPSQDDIGQQAVEAVGIDAAPTLTPIVATFEVLTGPTGRIPFGVLDSQQQPLLDRAAKVWVVRDGEVMTGPVDPIFFGEGLGQRGIYVAEVALEEPGLYDAVVQVDDDAVGVASFTAQSPEQSSTFPPGAEFPAIATPTTDDPGELEELCTREPDCTMHGTSLDTVVGRQPVVFTVATPAFCQTAVCGPVVDVVEDVRDTSDRDDVAYVHAEVYVDAGVNATPVVNELALPSEPWTWVIGADGKVVDRFDGPVVPDLLRDALARA
jgi:hypothetical protein